jgi:hypothetical protein
MLIDLEPAAGLGGSGGGGAEALTLRFMVCLDISPFPWPTAFTRQQIV